MSVEVWSEKWQPAERRLEDIVACMQDDGVVPLLGGDYDRWDIEARGGLLGSARLRHTVEEHGSGRQLLRYRIWPRPSSLGVALSLALGILSMLAQWDGARPAAFLLALFAAGGLGVLLAECGCACGAVLRSVADRPRRAPDSGPPRGSGEQEFEVTG
jgi:hypothetical protein